MRMMRTLENRCCGVPSRMICQPLRVRMAIPRRPPTRVAASRCGSSRQTWHNSLVCVLQRLTRVAICCWPRCGRFSQNARSTPDWLPGSLFNFLETGIRLKKTLFQVKLLVKRENLGVFETTVVRDSFEAVKLKRELYSVLDQLFQKRGDGDKENNPSEGSNNNSSKQTFESRLQLFWCMRVE